MPYVGTALLSTAALPTCAAYAFSGSVATPSSMRSPLVWLLHPQTVPCASATDATAFKAAVSAIEARLDALEREIAGSFFAGERFGLVDAAFAPVFRYLDVLERALGFSLVERGRKVAAWSRELMSRPSVIGAVPLDYADRLLSFVTGKNSHLARLIRDTVLVAA